MADFFKFIHLADAQHEITHNTMNITYIRITRHVLCIKTIKKKYHKS